jgi:hypothetical protein
VFVSALPTRLSFKKILPQGTAPNTNFISRPLLQHTAHAGEVRNLHTKGLISVCLHCWIAILPSQVPLTSAYLILEPSAPREYLIDKKSSIVHCSLTIQRTVKQFLRQRLIGDLSPAGQSKNGSSVTEFEIYCWRQFTESFNKQQTQL